MISKSDRHPIINGIEIAQEIWNSAFDRGSELRNFVNKQVLFRVGPVSWDMQGKDSHIEDTSDKHHKKEASWNNINAQITKELSSP